jgi:ribosomal-protein-alanine N-acetyltransferase
MMLEVRASNTAAQKLYEKTGWEKVGVRRNYYSFPREDGILYNLLCI